MRLANVFRTLSAAFVAALAVTFFSAAPSALAEETVLYEGGWTNVKQRTSGNWQVVERDGQTYIEFDDAFKTRRAPDLKVFLSTEDAATRANRNALDNAVFIGELQSAKGAQSYLVPDGVDVSQFSTLLIHCQQYTKFWAASELTQAGS
ncbi:MAG: DM13 domain-containing protein [Pseudomonadota bacterium]